MVARYTVVGPDGLTHEGGSKAAALAAGREYVRKTWIGGTVVVRDGEEEIARWVREDTSHVSSRTPSNAHPPRPPGSWRSGTPEALRAERGQGKVVSVRLPQEAVERLRAHVEATGESASATVARLVLSLDSGGG